MARRTHALALLALGLAACSTFHEDTGGALDGAVDGRSLDAPGISLPDARADSHRASDASDGGAARSCASGCGAGGAGAESCCASPVVEGGTFYRTYDPDGLDGGIELGPDGAATGTADPATITSFRLDRYLVTVGRFRAFVNAVLPPDGGVGWSPPIGSGKHSYLNGGLGLAATGGGNEPGWAVGDRSNIAPTDENLNCDQNVTMAATWTPYPSTNEYYPINCVNWYEAYAFCIWDGGFLPSDAELEYAAAGGADQREYPWGSTDPGTANEYAIYGTVETNGGGFEDPVCYYPDGVFCSGVSGSLAPVGTPPLGVGRWGQTDLTGELWEWTLDWYDNDGFVNPCVDCAYLTPPSSSSTTADGRVIHGSDFMSQLFQLPVSDRFYEDPAVRVSIMGIRCARAVE
jgi:formylglycine-generating enzyme required for sulfatase activity